MCKILFREYGVFYDGRKDGYNANGGGGIANGMGVVLINNKMLMVFPHSLINHYGEDDEAGMHTYIILSDDFGKTWTKPRLFGPSTVRDPGRETLSIGITGPTLKGTLLSCGYHQVLKPEDDRFHKDLTLRDYMLLIGRREKNEDDFIYKQYPSGTFLGEQFMESYLQLPSGRILFGIWGLKERGENWRCGVLISDDDGITWKYRNIGYEPDPGIRDNPAIPAGFNEQSLFRTVDGKIISIIRGRAKLGRVEGSPKDTWFFRAVSEDEGETWSKPEPAGIAGTGAAVTGLTLPDGSLLHACRIPYSRDMYELPEPDLYGLHLARSFDEGKTWKTELLVQRDPEGNPFTYYYNAMNGQFLKLGEREYLYIFGHFGYLEKMHRILALKFAIEY